MVHFWKAKISSIPIMRKSTTCKTLGYNVEFTNRAKAIVGVKDFFVQLQHDFDPTRTSEHFLPAGSEHNFTQFWAEYLSDKPKEFQMVGFI